MQALEHSNGTCARAHRDCNRAIGDRACGTAAGDFQVAISQMPTRSWARCRGTAHAFERSALALLDAGERG